MMKTKEIYYSICVSIVKFPLYPFQYISCKGWQFMRADKFIMEDRIFFERFEGNSILLKTPKLDFFPFETRFFPMKFDFLANLYKFYNEKFDFRQKIV